ncbi:uncharacterized protein LOC142323419 [Lycorma delicatula]|uniref:uncharacterized protein LOC142323419 n=1 Tax=Lycorma delicatula TaxID=130591 RepID=UPI003F510E20
MDFQDLHLKTDGPKFTNFPGISSMPFSYLSKFDFLNYKDKSMAGYHNTTRCSSATSNHFAQEVDIMNFVPGFRTEHSQRYCDFSKGLHPTNNFKKLDSYSQFSTINILSYLVGGFVGSKSQIGFTSMQGDRFQIWDLVWQKLIEIMGVNESNISDTEKCEDLVKFQEHSEIEKCEKPVKQTYADVAKIKVKNSLVNKNKQITMKENNSRSGKQKKKQSLPMDCLYKGKLDFGRSEKKISLQEMNSFSSSRWSNSRRKHCKKGIEKMSRRDEREAARDGLDFVNQDLDRCMKYKTQILVNNNNISNYKPNNNVKVRCGKRTKKPASFISNKSYDYVIDQENLKHGCEPDFGSLRKTNSDKNCDNDQGYTAITSCNNDNLRHRINSTCSVDSDDSFIVFDRSSNSDEEILTRLCFSNTDTQTDEEEEEDDDSTTSSDFSDIDLCIISGKPTDKLFPRIKNSWQIEKDNYNKYDLENICVINYHSCKCNTPKKTENSKSLIQNLSYVVSSGSSNSQSSSDNCGFKITLEESNNKDMKCRSVSESSLESEDSFIIFSSADDIDDDVLSGCGTDNSVSEYDCETQGIDSSSHLEDFDSDEDFDQLNCALLTPYATDHSYDTKSWLEGVNSEWEDAFNKNTETEKKIWSKKVHFPPDEKLTTVKKLLTWNYALRAARVGPWEELARDTMRFQNRIHCVGEVLQSVLDSKHRQKVFKERFSNEYENNNVSENL